MPNGRRGLVIASDPGLHHDATLRQEKEVAAESHPASPECRSANARGATGDARLRGCGPGGDALLSSRNLLPGKRPDPARTFGDAPSQHMGFLRGMEDLRWGRDISRVSPSGWFTSKRGAAGGQHDLDISGGFKESKIRSRPSTDEGFSFLKSGTNIKVLISRRDGCEDRLGSFSTFQTRAELVWCNPTIGCAERSQTLRRRAISGSRIGAPS